MDLEVVRVRPEAALAREAQALVHDRLELVEPAAAPEHLGEVAVTARGVLVPARGDRHLDAPAEQRQPARIAELGARDAEVVERERRQVRPSRAPGQLARTLEQPLPRAAGRR